MANIGIIGTGIFGTALAVTAAKAGNNVLCWDRNAEVINSINKKHVNAIHLPEISLPHDISATADLAQIFSFAEVILLAVSAQATRSVLKQLKPFIKPETIIVFCAKGLEAQSGKMLSEIAAEEIPQTEIAVLTGPGFAIDIARGKLTCVTIASAQEGTAHKITQLLGTSYFRPYSTQDIIAPQIGGSVKNVIAIASGIIEGAQLGVGARAALITRGLAEMTRLSMAMGGNLTTLMGMCGLGDLVLTAGSTQSRNFSFGYEVGICGHAQKVLSRNTQTVEGIYTTQAVIRLAYNLNVEMPICEIVYRILFEDMALNDAIKGLMSRPYKEEGAGF